MVSFLSKTLKNKHFKNGCRIAFAAFTICCVFQTSVESARSQEEHKWDPDRVGFLGVVTPFLKSHCADCHEGNAAEADLAISRDLTNSFMDRATASRWEEVVNVLNSHEMPPEDSPQPDPTETAEAIDWITSQLIRAEALRRENVVIMRRLNVDEYRRTINDLFGIEFDNSHFPEDPAAGGFDNNGSALSISPLHLELYFEAANQILDQVITVGPPPETIAWRFQPESGDSDSNRVRYDGQNLIVNGGKSRVSDGYKVMHHSSWDRKLNVRPFVVPAEGKYIIRIRAAAKVPSRQEVVESASQFLRSRQDREDKKHPDRKRYHEEAFSRDLEHFRNDPMYDYGPPRLRLIQHLGGQPKVLAEFDVSATLSQPEVYEIEAYFDRQRAGLTIEYAYSLPRVLENFWFQSDDSFARPELWVDWFEIEGPVVSPWPSLSHQRLFAGTPYEKQPFPIEEANSDNESQSTNQQQLTNNELAAAKTVLENLMPFAYRRPVTPNEIEEKLKLFVNSRSAGHSFRHAVRLSIVAVLMSPNFLFISEPDQTELGGTDREPLPKQPLDSYQLATRLAYFLWSSLPDERLFDLAKEDRLLEPATLRAEVDRMLADPKARALADNFAAQWLGLRQVGANPPAADLFPRYDVHLQESMVEESKAFFMEVLNQDLPVHNFIRSDFVVINERLARFYGISGVEGDEFRPVEIAADHHRGGIMTQGAMLTITSNGTRTSPVKRGTWLLENVLGTSPGLPVANAGEIAPKVPGIDKATVRVRLEAHRELPQCARCHNKIDPLGFALENFDASGRWREQEGFGYKGRVGRDDPVIDASSRLPDGTEIDGLKDLQVALIDQQDQFIKCLAKKLTGYAIGRELGLTDEQYLQPIVSRDDSELTLRDLVQSIVESELFRTK